MKGGIWKLTALGRKRAGGIYSSEARDSITSYLYETKTASVEELSSISGKSGSEVRSFLRQLERQGLAEQIGGS